MNHVKVHVIGECLHDWEEVGESIDVTSYDTFTMRIKGVSKVWSACKPGKNNFFTCTYRGLELTLHPQDHEIFPFGYNKVCLECGEKRYWDEDIVDGIRTMLEEEYAMRAAELKTKYADEAAASQIPSAPCSSIRRASIWTRARSYCSIVRHEPNMSTSAYNPH